MSDVQTRAEMAGVSPEALEELQRMERTLHAMLPHPTEQDATTYMFGLIADLRARVDRIERLLQIRGMEG